MIQKKKDSAIKLNADGVKSMFIMIVVTKPAF